MVGCGGVKQEMMRACHVNLGSYIMDFTGVGILLHSAGLKLELGLGSGRAFVRLQLARF